MPKGTSKSTAIIQRLLEERRQYEAWIARLNDSADASPGHVRARVRSDYEARLAAVTEELKAHAESARQAIEEKRHLRGELQKKEALAAEKLTETELRHAVGEYDEGQWEQVHKDVLAELISVREDLQAVEADIHKLQELDALVGNKPLVRSTPPPKPQPHARPTPQKVGHEDELAFIKSVTEDDDAAPSARRASGAQFQPVVPADMPRAQPPSAPRAANPSPAPVLPEASDSAGDEQADKTLKCKECGTMNRPTEWYCQQCGAELAAF
ncbi:MAG: hypothetical protein AUH12_02765 [Gemmatimonadetes bacterium 13_2_20CM_69_8]|nr:MAG: hypothetical protein AUH12_02765 [Gemmatimonadetes bacterium 13_2_20CM_69_8]